MASVTIEPPGRLSRGISTEVRMAWVTVQVGVGVRYVRYVGYNPLALGLSVF